MRIGEQLLAKVLQEARSEGYRRVVLGSHPSPKAAHALYAAAGIRRMSPPDDVQDRIKKIAIFMERDL